MTGHFVRFDEVKRKVRIQECLEVFGIRDRFRQSGNRLVSACPLPFHPGGPGRQYANEDQFVITENPDAYDLYICFSDCRQHPSGLGKGDVISFVMAMTGFDQAKCRRWFAEHFGSRLNLKRPGKTVASNGRKREANDGAGDVGQERQPESSASEATVTVSPGGKAGKQKVKPLSFRLNLSRDEAQEFLERRGISVAAADRYGVGVCGKGLFEGYVCVPIYRWPRQSPAERPVGYLGRWPNEQYAEHSKPRYRLPDGFPSSEVVFGVEQALSGSGENDCLVLVEGPMKAVWLADRKFAAVSSFTAAVSAAQADILARTGRPIVLCFDANPAGIEGMRKAAALLITRMLCRVVRLPEGKEPDELNAAALEDYLGFARVK